MGYPMTYFGFLAGFLLIPIALLLLLLGWARRRGVLMPANLRHLPPWAAVLLHVLLALLYATPWDNYLVVTRVWWYDPALVTGLVLGWVPVEEYTFFVLQTLLTGTWLLWLSSVLSPRPTWQASPRWRVLSLLPLGLIWLIAAWLLVTHVTRANYVALILVWALPPIALQLAFGADILWRYRKLVVTAVLVPTLYLALADTLAIAEGIWIISPAQTLGVHLPGGLPVEEALFFLVTNTLIGFGMTLALAEESWQRLIPLVARLPRVTSTFTDT
jgi:lycopene cyclase domain-containing protein